MLSESLPWFYLMLLIVLVVILIGFTWKALCSICFEKCYIKVYYYYYYYYYFHIFNVPQHPLVLGYPWLVPHNPHTEWPSGKVLSWGRDCKMQCLAGPPDSSSDGVSTSPEDVNEEEFLDLSLVPPCYLDLDHIRSTMAAEYHVSLLERNKENMVELRPCARTFTCWCEMSQDEGCECALSSRGYGYFYGQGCKIH